MTTTSRPTSGDTTLAHIPATELRNGDRVRHGDDFRTVTKAWHVTRVRSAQGTRTDSVKARLDGLPVPAEWDTGQVLTVEVLTVERTADTADEQHPDWPTVDPDGTTPHRSTAVATIQISEVDFTAGQLPVSQHIRRALGPDAIRVTTVAYSNGTHTTVDGRTITDLGNYRLPSDISAGDYVVLTANHGSGELNVGYSRRSRNT